VNCYFSSAAVNLASGATVNVQLTIDTNNPPGGGAIALQETREGYHRILAALALPFVAIFCSAKAPRRRRGFVRIARCAVLCAAIADSGCSGVTHDSTPPGTYTLQVAGTGTTSQITHVHNVTLTVTQ
jgi:hypothetical protein